MSIPSLVQWPSQQSAAEPAPLRAPSADSQPVFESTLVDFLCNGWMKGDAVSDPAVSMPPEDSTPALALDSELPSEDEELYGVAMSMSAAPFLVEARLWNEIVSKTANQSTSDTPLSESRLVGSLGAPPLAEIDINPAGSTGGSEDRWSVLPAVLMPGVPTVQPGADLEANVVSSSLTSALRAAPAIPPLRQSDAVRARPSTEPSSDAVPTTQREGARVGNRTWPEGTARAIRASESTPDVEPLAQTAESMAQTAESMAQTVESMATAKSMGFDTAASNGAAIAATARKGDSRATLPWGQARPKRDTARSAVYPSSGNSVPQQPQLQYPQQTAPLEPPHLRNTVRPETAVTSRPSSGLRVRGSNEARSLTMPLGVASLMVESVPLSATPRTMDAAHPVMRADVEEAMRRADSTSHISGVRSAERLQAEEPAEGPPSNDFSEVRVAVEAAVSSERSEKPNTLSAVNEAPAVLLPEQVFLAPTNEGPLREAVLRLVEDAKSGVSQDAREVRQRDVDGGVDAMTLSRGIVAHATLQDGERVKVSAVREGAKLDLDVRLDNREAVELLSLVRTDLIHELDNSNLGKVSVGYQAFSGSMNDSRQSRQEAPSRHSDEAHFDGASAPVAASAPAASSRVRVVL